MARPRCNIRHVRKKCVDTKEVVANKENSFYIEGTAD